MLKLSCLSRIGLVVLCCVWTWSCIHPPEVKHASVLPREELEVISLIDQGKNYAARGRAELAEDAFRKALAMQPTMGSLYNDLGLALQSQQRLSEAETVYRKALELLPNNVIARDNLARVLYQKGEPESALKEYDLIIDVINRVPADQVLQSSGAELGNDELIRVYRDKAIVYYDLGIYDEAVCYSWLASSLAASFVEAGQHARLLMSLDKTQQALQVLRDVVTVHQANVPSKILLDYSIALFVTGDHNLAKAAITRMLGFAVISRADRRTAHMLKLLLAIEEKSEKEATIIKDTLLEEDSDLCELDFIDKENYWPISFIDEMKALLGRLCNDKDKPILQN
jgi:hypothetical protein